MSKPNDAFDVVCRTCEASRRVVGRIGLIEAIMTWRCPFCGCIEPPYICPFVYLSKLN
jgi:hypothetical protein